MQATTMLASQRCPVQARLPLRATQLGSNACIRGAPLAATFAAPPPARALVARAVVAAAATDAPTEVVAHLRFIRGSPFKVRRVLDQIRGRSYEEALMILEYMPYKACEPVIKTLLSAAANAKNNMGLKKKDLIVSECYANPGPILKRVQPHAQGRPFPIHKPTLHLCVKVAEKP